MLFRLASTFLLNKLIGLGIQKFQQVIEIYDTLAERLSDCSFSLFIQMDSNTPELRKRLLDAYRTWIEANVIAATPHVFIIFNKDVLFNDDVFRTFFESSSFLSDVYKGVEKALNEKKETDSLEEFINSIFNQSFFSGLLNIIDDILIQPFKVVEEICSQLLAVVKQNPSDEITAVKQFLNKFAEQEQPNYIILTIEEELLKLNPLLHLISPTILAHIRHYYYMAQLEEAPRLITPPKEYLQALFADLYVNNEHQISVNPNEDLNIAIEIPTKPEWIRPAKHEVVLNYAGITRKGEFAIIPPLEVTVKDYGTMGYMSCYTQGSLPSKGSDAQWDGDFIMDCTAVNSTAYTFIWLEFSHNYGSEPFRIAFNVGAYIEACYDYTGIYVGYKENDTFYLTKIADIPYTFTQPGWITLEGTFPSPDFVVAFYHECSGGVMNVTGIRLKGIRYSVIT